MSKTFYKPWSAGQVVAANEILDRLRSIYTNYNGAISDINFKKLANLHGSKFKDASIRSRNIKHTYADARATAALNLTTSEQDITGTTLTVTPDTPQVAFITGFFDFDGIKSASGVAIGRLSVDSVIQTQEALFSNSSATARRATVGQLWAVNLTAGVSHTLKLRALINGSDTGTELAQISHTHMIYELISQ